jgi:uncharacterized protein (DUF362 family)
MATFSRRDFLRTGALAAGALTIGPLARAQESSAPMDMVIARSASAPSPDDNMAALAEKLTQQAIENLGGMGRFVSRGDVVWVKPNIAWDRTPEYAANTNPDVVKTLVRLCYEAGAKTVKIGDNPCNDIQATYKNSGIIDAAKSVDGEIVFVDRNRFRSMEIGGERLKSHPVYPEMYEADVMIDVPVAKHHGSTTVTLCMKNLMGVVEDRGTFHQDLPTTIADISGFIKPKLCVLDAMRILTAHGPTGGNLDDVKILNTIAAGVDIVAMDAFGCELLGHKPADIATVLAGSQRGLGEIDYRKLLMKEITAA